MRWFDWVVDLFGRKTKKPKPPAPPPVEPPDDPPPPPEEPPAPPSGLRVEIRFADQVAVYDQAAGVEKERWTNPLSGAQQRRIVAPVVKELFSVEFRPEADWSRDEIVFAWGDIKAVGHPLANQSLPRYTVDIFRDGVLIAAQTIPPIIAADVGQPWEIDAQMWLTRWRWQSKKRPILRDAVALKAAGLVPPFDASVATEAIPAPAEAYVPLGTSSWTRYFPTTGAHQDIGLMPVWHACFIATNDPVMGQSVLDYDEAANSFAWCIRENDAPWDWRNYPKASFDGRQYLYGIEPPLAPQYVAEAGISMDTAHAPCGPALAFMMTGDAYHLEAMQFVANWMIGSDPYPLGGLVKRNQTRGAAWALNNLANAWHVTPDSVPAWLMPKSYWFDRLAMNRQDLVATYQLANDPKQSVFHSMMPPEAMPFWQDTFLGDVFRLLDRYGATGWGDLAKWKAVNIKSRYGDTEWPRSFPLPVSGWIVNWGTSWAEAAQLNAIVATADGNMVGGLDSMYPVFDAAGLALEAMAGDQVAKAQFDWLSAQLDAQNFRRDWQWAFKP